MRKILQTSVLTSLGFVFLLGYQNCTKVKNVRQVPVAQGELSPDWKDVHARK